jgi:hypothetical protein
MANISLGLPERSMTTALLRRGALLWFFARLALLAVGAMRPDRGTWRLGTSAAFMLIIAVGALGYLEARRRNEHRFLANLGVSPTMIIVLSLLPAFAAEIVLGLVS